MSYSAFEGSVELGRPVEIYEFTAGAESFFYTTAEDDQLVSAQPYLAVEGLQRGKTVDGPERRSDDFTVQLPTSDNVAQLFVGVMPGFRVKLQVRRFHRDDTPTPEVVKIFDGFIRTASFSRDGKQVTLIARSELAADGTQIPRRTYQSSCNHVLYDSLTCRVDDTDVAFRASALDVVSLVGNVLTVVSGIQGTYADGFMNGGYVEAIGVSDFRMIESQVGDVLTLLSPFSSEPATVNVLAGCDHSIQVCKSKFNIVINFGGSAFVPTRNPFEVGIL